jgi:phage FluMu gp28-like protein
MKQRGRAKNIPKNPDRVFLDYQSAWIDDFSLLKLMEKSRQIGISWATADACVERTGAKDNRHDQWVSSRDDIQARLFLEDCQRFANTYKMAAENLGMMFVDDDKKFSAYVLKFANGHRIHSMSSNPDAQAGKKGGRVLDEFALHKDPRKLYSIAQPGITWGGQLEIISTHRGSANFFNELVEDVKHRGNPMGFSLHTVTLQNALDQGFLYKLQQTLPITDKRQAMDEAEYFDFIRSQCASEEQFLQEYMCVPADDEGAFLSYDLIAGVEYHGGIKWEITDTGFTPEGDKTSPLYVGVDVGRKNDLTVIWIIEPVAGVNLTRKVICMQNKKFGAQESELYKWLALSQTRRCCIDETGLGMQFAERAIEKFGAYRVEAVRFTGPVKEELAYPVRAAFEDKSVKIPRDDKIRADLRGIKKTTTAAGNIRFEADSGPGGHSDRFWALALAMHAAKGTVVAAAAEPREPDESHYHAERPEGITSRLRRGFGGSRSEVRGQRSEGKHGN